MRRAGDILRVFLDRNTAEQAEHYHTFFTGWHEVVGERIAAHSQVKDIQNGIVVVEVDHPGWIQMIQLKNSQFVGALQRRYPDLEIRGLRLQLPWTPGARGAAAAEENGGPPRDRGIARRREGAGAESAGGTAAAREGDHAADFVESEDSSESVAAEELPPDPRIRGALERLKDSIEERSRSD